MDIISRKDAKMLGLKRYYTGKVCKNGHDSERLIDNYSCIGCMATYNANWVLNNQPTIKKIRQKSNNKYVEKNRTLINLNHRIKYCTTPEPYLIQGKKWKDNNKQYLKIKNSEYANIHKEEFVARNALRRSRKLKATPKWETGGNIKDFYICSKMFKLYTGITYNVDHIVPLNSKYVCGLHCEDNLQILSEVDNKSKNNRYWPDMWEPE